MGFVIVDAVVVVVVVENFPFRGAHEHKLHAQIDCNDDGLLVDKLQYAFGAAQL